MFVFSSLYILRGLKLTPKDDDGLSDPYLIVKARFTQSRCRQSLAVLV